ncbi:hypothetical protein ABID39_000428 [Bartonella japonica]|uniref:Uncharacterized protein n=1 Tax=Bartonella japonica TaxID=357761 RepID=A0ABV2FMF3_9HYPH
MNTKVFTMYILNIFVVILPKILSIIGIGR